MPNPGPHVVAAAICEKVLQEQDGVLSLIRIIDRVMIQVRGDQVPGELPEGGGMNVTLAVLLRSGDARGRHPISVSVETPDGRELPPQPMDVLFEQPDAGANLILNMSLPAIEGLYWLIVTVDDRELTRTPLRVIYQRMPTLPGLPPAGQA